MTSQLRASGDPHCCRVCHEYFAGARWPVILIGCGHSICSDCAEAQAKYRGKPDALPNVLVCPACQLETFLPTYVQEAEKQSNIVLSPQRLAVERLPRNYGLLSKGRNPYPMCEEHDMPRGFYCPSHAEAICAQCLSEHHRECPFKACEVRDAKPVLLQTLQHTRKTLETSLSRTHAIREKLSGRHAELEKQIYEQHCSNVMSWMERCMQIGVDAIAQSTEVHHARLRQILDGQQTLGDAERQIEATLRALDNADQLPPAALVDAMPLLRQVVDVPDTSVAEGKLPGVDLFSSSPSESAATTSSSLSIIGAGVPKAHLPRMEGLYGERILLSDQGLSREANARVEDGGEGDFARTSNLVLVDVETKTVITRLLEKSVKAPNGVCEVTTEVEVEDRSAAAGIMAMATGEQNHRQISNNVADATENYYGIQVNEEYAAASTPMMTNTQSINKNPLIRRRKQINREFAVCDTLNHRILLIDSTTGEITREIRQRARGTCINDFSPFGIAAVVGATPVKSVSELAAEDHRLLSEDYRNSIVPGAGSHNSQMNSLNASHNEKDGVTMMNTSFGRGGAAVAAAQHRPVAGGATPQSTGLTPRSTSIVQNNNLATSQRHHHHHPSASSTPQQQRDFFATSFNSDKNSIQSQTTRNHTNSRGSTTPTPQQQQQQQEKTQTTKSSSSSSSFLTEALLVTDCDNHRVYLIDALSGDFLKHWGNFRGSSADEFWSPLGVTQIRETMFAVADSGNHRIVVLNISHSGSLFTIELFQGIREFEMQRFFPSSVVSLPDKFVSTPDVHDTRITHESMQLAISCKLPTEQRNDCIVVVGLRFDVTRTSGYVNIAKSEESTTKRNDNSKPAAGNKTTTTTTANNTTMMAIPKFALSNMKSTPPKTIFEAPVKRFGRQARHTEPVFDMLNSEWGRTMSVLQKANADSAVAPCALFVTTTTTSSAFHEMLRRNYASEKNPPAWTDKLFFQDQYGSDPAANSVVLVVCDRANRCVWMLDPATGRLYDRIDGRQQQQQQQQQHNHSNNETTSGGATGELFFGAPCFVSRISPHVTIVPTTTTGVVKKNDVVASTSADVDVNSRGKKSTTSQGVINIIPSETSSSSVPSRIVPAPYSSSSSSTYDVNNTRTTVNDNSVRIEQQQGDAATLSKQSATTPLQQHLNNSDMSSHVQQMFPTAQKGTTVDDGVDLSSRTPPPTSAPSAATTTTKTTQVTTTGVQPPGLVVNNNDINNNNSDATTSSLLDYKTRLTRFYKKYNQSKLPSVDSTLKQFSGTEESLFKSLTQTYGPEPDQSLDDADIVAMDPKSRLTRFYDYYNPSKLSSVDSTLKQFSDDPDDLFKTLTNKYGPEPPVGAPSGGGVAAAEERQNQQRQKRMQQQQQGKSPSSPSVAPAVASSINNKGKKTPPPSPAASTLTAAAGKSKPSPSPTPSKSTTPKNAALPVVSAPQPSLPVNTTSTASSSSSSHQHHVDPNSNTDNDNDNKKPLTKEEQALRDRLVRFYKKWNPPKITDGSVEKALANYGVEKQDELFVQMCIKYGPEPVPTPPAFDLQKPTVTTSASAASAVLEPPVSSESSPKKQAEGEEQVTRRSITIEKSKEEKEYDMRLRLERFYKKHNPGKITDGSIEKAMSSYGVEKEDELFTAMVIKYGPEPIRTPPSFNHLEPPPAAATAAAAAAVPSAGASSTSQQQQQQQQQQQPPPPPPPREKTLEEKEADMRDRLARFYKKHKPAKMTDGSIEKAMSSYGVEKEDDLFAMLVGKYGSEPIRTPPSFSLEPTSSGNTTTKSPPAPAIPIPSAKKSAVATPSPSPVAPSPPSSSASTLPLSRNKTPPSTTLAAATTTGKRPPPSQAVAGKKKSSPSPTSSAINPYRTRLEKFYIKYNKDKLSSVDSTLAQYKGNEKELFQNLVKKYGPEP